MTSRGTNRIVHVIKFFVIRSVTPIRSSKVNSYEFFFFCIFCQPPKTSFLLLGVVI